MHAIIAAHKHSSQHRAEILSSRRCGCFYCLAIFLPTEVQDWVDWPEGTPEGQELDAGTTALCPHCGIDAVIGSSSGFPVTFEFLAEMRNHWFESSDAE